MIITLSEKEFRAIKVYAFEQQKYMTEFCRDFILQGIKKGRKNKDK